MLGAKDCLVQAVNATTHQACWGHHNAWHGACIGGAAMVCRESCSPVTVRVVRAEVCVFILFCIVGYVVVARAFGNERDYRNGGSRGAQTGLLLFLVVCYRQRAAQLM